MPAPSPSHILIRGARQHNLKGVDLDIPRNRLVVVTGPSGSGKSSLVFDTLYAEGQRRYVESLSAYARRFLDLHEKPDVDRIDGLSPAVAIEQKGPSRSRRSTVATITEIYDHLRLLFARAGSIHCPSCRRPLSRQTVQQIVDRVAALGPGTRFQILAPVPAGTEDPVEVLRRQGFVRARIDGEVRSLDEPFDASSARAVEAVVDRLSVSEGIGRRLADSIETALALNGRVVVVDIPGGEALRFTTAYHCVDCDLTVPDPEPRLFSFNSPHGACPACRGLGERREVHADRVVPDPGRSIAEGALVPLGVPKGRTEAERFGRLAGRLGFRLDTPFRDLPEAAQKAVLFGAAGKSAFEGVIPSLQKRYDEAATDEEREGIEPFTRPAPCPSCGGARLRPEALSVRVGGRTIAEACAMPVSEAAPFFDALSPDGAPEKVTAPILREIRARLAFLNDVGVGYLSLDRPGNTLSGGETQRIRLATQIGSRLVGVLYVLDEPSVGLHPRDNRRLIEAVGRLRDLGNSVIVVEHDREMILAADHVIDLGPGAGELGGQVTAEGTPDQIRDVKGSLTGDYLAGRRSLPRPESPRRPRGTLALRGASGRNLKDVDLLLPLGVFVCVTGVSGSGKSTLINQTLYPALAERLYRTKEEPLPFGRLEGAERIDKVIRIDQAPIGRTPRSNPATYTGAFNAVRDLYAQLPEAKVRGYGPGRFSFNTRGGRCEVCRGDGLVRIEMHFLPDVYVTCEACEGRRFNRETLEVRYKGASIADVLDMTVDRARTFFRDIPQISRRLKSLFDVGLGYIRLGQSGTALSGGEAQRVKLAAELARTGTGNTLYLLDEPTTGLHFEDVRVLIEALDRLVDQGNTVLVIEHNLDVIGRADWIIDLGPEGGPGGGRIVAQGSPDEVARVAASHTGQFLQARVGT